MLKKKGLTDLEIIERIEQAPIEMQVRVAKAFIREDIDNDGIQYLFNEDGLDILNETGSNENIDAEEPDGIGAGVWSMRTSKPGKGNKNYITTGSGGWNTCIKGYPTDSECNVLANCVGYASGRFNEIINEIRGTTGCTYKTLNCNAWYFKERAEAAGLKTGSAPRVGAIMCWSKNGGAGHVAIVERINTDGTLYTSESGYGSKAFWNSTRSNSNGRWGIGNAYEFRCFIYLPDDVQKVIDDFINPPKPTPTPTPTPTEEWPKSYTVVSGDTLSGIAKKFYGNGDAVHYNYIARANGISNPSKIRVGQKLTIPEYKEESVPTPTPTPVPVTTDDIKVGDTVKIVGTGNGSTNGTGATAYGLGWTRNVLKIWEGKKYPYQIGNNSGTTGFYKKEALKKL